MSRCDAPQGIVCLDQYRQHDFPPVIGRLDPLVAGDVVVPEATATGALLDTGEEPDCDTGGIIYDGVDIRERRTRSA
jgi:hypothetical protein